MTIEGERGSLRAAIKALPLVGRLIEAYLWLVMSRCGINSDEWLAATELQAAYSALERKLRAALEDRGEQ